MLSKLRSIGPLSALAVCVAAFPAARLVRAAPYDGAGSPQTALTGGGSDAAGTIALRRAGDRSMQGGNFDDAARTYLKAALSAPNDPIERLLAGVALATIRQPDAAAGQFRQACRITSDDLIASLLLQGALNENGDTSSAQTVYLEAVRRYGRRDTSGGLDATSSLSMLRKALTASPDSPILYLLMGDAYQLSEQWAKADDAYGHAIALAPHWIKPRVNLGLSRLAQNHTPEAIAIFEQALARDPDNVQLLFYHADAERQAGNLPAAISSYQRIQSRTIVHRQPAVVAQALTGLGQAYAAGGRYSDAVNVLNQARQIAPTDPAPPAALAEVQSRQKDYSGAAASFDSALRLTKANGLFGTESVLYQALAQAQIAGHQPDAALATLTRAMSDEPGNAATWECLRGEALLTGGNADGALQSFKAALNVSDDAGTFPQETLAVIASRGMLTRIASSYLADIRGGPNAVRADTPTANGGRIYSNSFGVPASEFIAYDARAHAALGAIAQYRGDVNGEIEERETLTSLRSRASDWYALAEAYDQRARDPARAKAAYTKALNLGGLPPEQAERARTKVAAYNRAAANTRQ